MTDPRWGDAFASAFAQLTALWPDKVAVGAAISGVCALMETDVALAYICFGMLTGDMTARVAVCCKRNRPLCRGLKRALPRYVCYLIFIVMAWAAQVAFQRGLHVGLPIVDIMLAYLILTDTASIIGHLHYLGVPVPPVLKWLVFGGRERLKNRVREETGQERH